MAIAAEGIVLGIFRLILHAEAVPFSGPDGVGDIGGKQQQQGDAGQPGEIPVNVGIQRVEDRRGEEENHRRTEGSRFHLTGPHREGDGRDQRRVADHAADGIAVSNFTVAAEGAGCGNQHLRQGSSDGYHRCSDHELRYMKTAGQIRGTVHKPVSALNQQNQSEYE